MPNLWYSNVSNIGQVKEDIAMKWTRYCAYCGKYKKVYKRKPSMGRKKCPKCGKDLVIRKGMYGAFAACPGYPKCKYIEGGFTSKFTKKKEEKPKVRKSSKPKTKI